MSAVRNVSRWTGYCIRCDEGDRPLVLTLHGSAGPRAWLSGSSWHDRELRLSCVCCGHIEPVGWEDEPTLEVVPEVDILAPVAPVASAADVGSAWGSWDGADSDASHGAALPPGPTAADPQPVLPPARQDEDALDLAFARLGLLS